MLYFDDLGWLSLIRWLKNIFLCICRASQWNTSWITWIVLVKWWVRVTCYILSALLISSPLSSSNKMCCFFQKYIPSKQDILFARKATKGIVEHDFIIKKIPFKMVDVGGQRSQRQKWFQCFDGITSILFMVSSSEYDQVTLMHVWSCNHVETRRVTQCDPYSLDF